MSMETRLEIRLTAGIISPNWRRGCVNEIRGGPETLLNWLETQLGLPVPATHEADRVTEYAAALDTVTDSVISPSMRADRWATAAELLARRDELLLAGWDETDSESLPELVRDLARAVQGRSLNFPGEATRLNRVSKAIQAGQTLPPHHCVLQDSIENWPPVWRGVLASLTISEPAEFRPNAPENSALNTAQDAVRVGTADSIKMDSTFRHVKTRSETAAVEFVTAILTLSPEKLAKTVICCEDDEVAMRLDACLRRVGLPTTGASAWSRAHPVLQVLPLSIMLCWEPVDPQALLDFLVLPISPIPRNASSKLAKALTRQPGMGSTEWELVMAKLCDKENDPEGKLQERLEAWLLGDRISRGAAIPTQLVRERSALVAQWASGRASALAKEGNASPELIQALQVAAGQASLLGSLAETQQGPVLSEPQLTRLLEESLAAGVKTISCIEAVGGPIRVRSLAEVNGVYDRLIWLGLGTGEAEGSRWSTDQQRLLRAQGIDIDDGSKALSALRSAEARGFNFIKEAFLAVLLPQDLEKRWHPLWLAVRALFPEKTRDQPPVFEDLIESGDTATLAPFGFECSESDRVPAQPVRALWEIPAELLEEREQTSATELQDRLACPLKWTLTYQAKLSPSKVAQLPGDFQLKGAFCHGVLEQVFGDGNDLPSIDDAVSSVLSTFDDRLPRDAAPLAQPDKYLERQQLRSELENSTRVLIGALANGGYRITGLEVELSGSAFGRPLIGSIDCVAERDKGDEVLIDFKYSGNKKYHALIEEGKAVQLATYAYGRSTVRGRFPGVAYLVLSDGLLYTPSGSPMEGYQAPINSPSIQQVWQKFSTALGNADGWLTSNEPIPARPVQDKSEWPTGVSLALKEKLDHGEIQQVCKYCKFKNLCGLQETK